jgi:DNA recombination protein RmuC
MGIFVCNIKSMIEIISLLLLAIVCVLLIAMFLRKKDEGTVLLERKVDELEKFLMRIENALREDFRNNREELSTALEKNSKSQMEKIESLISKIEEKNKENKESIEKAFKGFQENFDRNVESFNNLQREKFGQLADKQKELVESTEKQLEKINNTVDEKLQKTLNERLSQSFELVGKQLESVQSGLGEMRTIASDVGGLKKVLSNVKLRGNVGEVQLAMILEQILAPTQYEANVKTREGSADPVEFAVKLPGRSDDEKSIVYLPIDAKFPKDVYENLVSAYDKGSIEEIEAATKLMEAAIKKNAKDIRDKYIDPPNTTDFAIMFLPFESIYAEVIRRSALVDQLRDEFKITVAGPTTLVAILNSLQMGFRTLALQKRSSEVWKILGSVKKEFDNFGGLLEKAQKNIQTGLGQLDDIVGTRTRAIKRHLRAVDNLPESEEAAILPDINLELNPGENDE